MADSDVNNPRKAHIKMADWDVTNPRKCIMKKLLVLRIFKQLQINEGTHRRSTSQPERRNEKIKLSHICYEWCDFCKLVTDRALQTQVSLPDISYKVDTNCGNVVKPVAQCCGIWIGIAIQIFEFLINGNKNFNPLPSQYIHIYMLSKC